MGRAIRQRATRLDEHFFHASAQPESTPKALANRNAVKPPLATASGMSYPASKALTEKFWIDVPLRLSSTNRKVRAKTAGVNTLAPPPAFDLATAFREAALADALELDGSHSNASATMPARPATAKASRLLPCQAAMPSRTGGARAAPA